MLDLLAWHRCMRIGVIALAAGVLVAPFPAPTFAQQDKRIVRDRTLEERFEGGRKWAVVIGVNSYLDPSVPNLRYAVADARLVQSVLTRKCGYEPKRVLLMVEGLNVKQHLWPLRINLLSQVADWLKRAEPGDTVLVFFSGHGFLDDRGQGYLAPQDCQREHLALSGFRLDDLRNMLTACRASQKLLLLDCCHSGTGKSIGPTGASSQELSPAFQKATGLITFASCRKSEQSFEWEEKQHGLFTYFLAEGLQGKSDYDRDGIVDSGELYRFLADEVSRTAQVDLNTRQNPVRIVGDDVFGVFALARTTKDDAEFPPTGEGLQLVASSDASMRLYRKAALTQNSGEFSVAAGTWREFLEKYTRDKLAPRAQHYEGICLYKMERYGEAKDAFQRVLKDYPKCDKLNETVLNLGYCQLMIGKTGNADMCAAAERALEWSLKHNEHRDQLLFHLGDARFYQRDLDGAVECYQRVIDEYPGSSMRGEAMYALGVTREDLGQYEAAGKVYDQFLSEFGGNSEHATEIRMRKAGMILQAGLAQEAAVAATDKSRELFLKAERMFAAVAAVPGFNLADHALFRQATCVAKRDDYGAAAKLYALAANQPGARYRARATMDAGRAFYRAQNFDAAAKWFRAVMQGGGPDAAEAAHWTCQILLKQQKCPEAAKLASQWISLATDSPYLVNLKSDQAEAKYRDKTTRAESIPLYLALVRHHPNGSLAAQSLYNAAFAEYELNKYQETITHAKQFIAQYDGHAFTPDARHLLADSHLMLGKTSDATRLYEKLIADYPQHGERDNWTRRLDLARQLLKKERKNN